jgi:tripartite-type tricarboxylate transporter receptor subunit TctC
MSARRGSGMKDRLVVLALALGIAVGAGGQGNAQSGYPDRAIRIVVPFAPGGTADIVARIAAEQVAADLGWRVYVENITGADGSVGAAAAARAPADGYTLLVCNVSCAANQFLLGNTGLDPEADLAPVIVLGNVPNVLVVGPSVSATTLAELIAFARANPGKVSIASSGPGSSSHLTAMLLRVKAQIDIVDVPYRGSSAAMPDILSGRVDGMVMGLPESLPFVRDGKLKALGVTPNKRASALPNVPTFAQAGVPDYSFLGWLSLFVPQRTPAAAPHKLNAAFAKSLQSPALLSRFAEQSIEPVGGPAELAGRLLKSDIVLWRQILEKPKG